MRSVEGGVWSVDCGVGVRNVKVECGARGVEECGLWVDWRVEGLHLSALLFVSGCFVCFIDSEEEKSYLLSPFNLFPGGC